MTREVELKLWEISQAMSEQTRINFFNHHGRIPRDNDELMMYWCEYEDPNRDNRGA